MYPDADCGKGVEVGVGGIGVDVGVAITPGASVGTGVVDDVAPETVPTKYAFNSELAYDECEPHPPPLVLNAFVASLPQ